MKTKEKQESEWADWKTDKTGTLTARTNWEIIKIERQGGIEWKAKKLRNCLANFGRKFEYTQCLAYIDIGR